MTLPVATRMVIPDNSAMGTEIKYKLVAIRTQMLRRKQCCIPWLSHGSRGLARGRRSRTIILLTMTPTVSASTPISISQRELTQKPMSSSKKKTGAHKSHNVEQVQLSTCVISPTTQVH